MPAKEHSQQLRILFAMEDFGAIWGSWAATYGCARFRNSCHFHGIVWDFDAVRFTTLSGLVIVTA
jgi:hypothetical protein